MNFKTLLCVSLGFSILPIVLTYFIKRKYRKKIKSLENKYRSPNDGYYYQCIFISSIEHVNCKQHIFEGLACGDNCSYNHLQTLISFIGSAQTSVSLCIYHFTLKQISQELINAQKRGVAVRIITDVGTSKFAKSKVQLLDQRTEVEVRTPPENLVNTYMHHKFCLIDEKNQDLAKMFFGSLNLTLQGCAANFEFVVLTNNLEIIKSFDSEFEKLWKEFE